MPDLSDARAELARLHRRELELLQELLDVRKALAAQKVLIDELVKASTPPPVDRLPNELLVQIFLLVGLHWPRLAYVSRRWNAVIMDTPSIWSEIFLDIYTDSTSLGLQLERSRQAPLTIRLYDYKPELLDVMMVHANRWHTLFILECALPFLRHISHLRFPSLEVLHVNLEPDSVDLLPMMYSRAPALESLRLEGFAEPLSSFNLTIGLSHKSFTRLLLVGIIDSWEFPRDNIHLPALKSLILQIKDPMSLLEAIVAPKLGHFEFSEGYCGDPVCRAFRGPRTKFDNVHHIIFSPMLHGPSGQVALDVAKELCQVFNGIRLAEIDAEYVIPLFSPCQTVDHPDDYRSPIDHWSCLERLEIRDFTFVEADPRKHLMDWFTKRRNLGQRRLHLKLMSNGPASDYPVSRSTSAYETLRECCLSVELDRIPVPTQTYLSTSADSLMLSSSAFPASPISQTDLVAMARSCPTQTVDTMRAQLWTF